MNNMPSVYRKRHFIWKLVAGIFVLYLFAPMIAGVFHFGDRRGPKIFWKEHHQLLFTLAYEFVYDENARANWAVERPWFYGLEGKPNPWYEAINAIRGYPRDFDEARLVLFRQLMWNEGKGPLPIIINRLDWPEDFVTNGVIEVRKEEFGICAVLKRQLDSEGGIVLFGNRNYADDAHKRYSMYCKDLFWRSGIYHYYRKLEK
jgi:hypothetical protein